jgi:hypothetical protein
MRIFVTLLASVFLIVSCKKETVDSLWQKSFGRGDAFFVRSSPDSGIVSCGMLNNKPYLVRLSKDKNIEVEFTSARDGLFNSVWFDDSCFIAGGNSNRKMLLARIDNEGYKVWDTTITEGFLIDRVNILYTGIGNLLAIGTASADSSDAVATGILFVRFDTTGNIIGNIDFIKETGFISANNAAIDNNGNIYLSLTRKTSGTKTKASVAKYSSDFQKLWETELYNNSNFGASGRGIIVNGDGDVFVTGKTEVSRDVGTLDESFLASLTGTGNIRWKRYIENSNAGASIILNDAGDLMMLNRNCFIVNLANPENGSDAGQIRMFSVCDSYDTDAFAESMDILSNNDLLAAGSKGDNFYIAVKPAE